MPEPRARERTTSRTQDGKPAAIAAAVTRRGTNHTIPAATKLEATTTDL